MSNIFLSHASQDAPLAKQFKQILLDTYGNALDIFVSSDARSIGAGEDWYLEIKEALSKATVVIVLITSRSIERKWIYWEAGGGVLSGKHVIPMAFGEISSTKIETPLNILQTRYGDKPEELEAIFNAISSKGNLPPSALDWTTLSNQLSAVESRLPRASLTVYPNITDTFEHFETRFDLKNTGTSDVELSELTVAVPTSIFRKGYMQSTKPPILTYTVEMINGLEYGIYHYQWIDVPVDKRYGVAQLVHAYLPKGKRVTVRDLVYAIGKPVNQDKLNLEVFVEVIGRSGVHVKDTMRVRDLIVPS